MKRFITTVFLGLGLCQAGVAGPAAPPITPEYYNYGFNGVLSPTPVVDAVAFYNQGNFDVETISSFSVTNKNEIFGNGYSYLPFMTKDTLYFTNTVSGSMEGEPGFQFDTGTSTTRHNASFVVNLGTIEGVDTEAVPYLYSVPGATAVVPVPVDNQPIASQVLVLSTNIVNSGSMAVGIAGLLSLTGNNVTNAFGTLSAGSVNTAGLFTDPLDTTGLTGQEENDIFVGGPYYYCPSPGVYDLFWGVTNAYTVFVDGLSVELEDLADNALDTLVPSIPATPRANSFAPGFFPLNYDNATWSVTATATTVNGTNIYYNVIFVNTNFSNTNMTATVGAGPAEFLQYASATVPPDENAFEDIVQIAEPVFDVITGQTVTNGIYLIDDGGLLPSMSLTYNASLPDGYERPNAFELTTTTPLEWEDAVIEAEEFAFPFISGFIYSDNTFNNNKEPFEISEYGAQIGRNPADIFGSFGSLAETNSFAYDYLNDYFIVNLLDPTNDPARIQISANNLDVSQARLRAEGMVILNATNLIGGGTSAVDWGEANASIGVSNGFLNISNIFPTTFQRIRGDIYAWSATWQNTQTNTLITGGAEAIGTNQWHYHVLVVDQNLFGSFPSTVRSLTLTGKNSIVLQDDLNVIDQAVINTTNLTIASSNYFSQYAQDFVPATTPYLQNLLIETNGFLGSYNILDVGFNVNKGQTPPAGRTYTVNTITNFGQMTSTAPLFESAIFMNDGGITANRGGSILIEASNLFLGLAPTNLVSSNTINTLTADGSVNLSAVSIQVSNSVISAGVAEPASLMLNATAQLSDLVSGIPTTNTNSVIVNHWTVTDGFSLESKPANGDLFGTEIHTISTNLQYVTHVWAATDWSNNVARGFSDNEVIGQLVLDRQSPNSVLHFSAAGAKNAMYVDYLCLTNYSTNYRTGLSIDANFTIYFAAANAEPEKLHEVYPNLVWVTNFVGPNSTYVVPYLPTNSGLYCLINSNVATSVDISFWPFRGNNFDLLNGLDGFPPDPYLLNNPTNALDIIPCNSSEINGDYTFACNCTPGTNLLQLIYTNFNSTGGATNPELDVLTISYNGQGTIANVPSQSQLALGQTYTLTAKPATGWVFDYWTTAEMDGATNTNYYSPNLTFTFVTNTVVTANFIPSPFPESAGVYNGLFFETNGVDPDSSGAISLTLAKTGSFSGKLLMGSNSYSFTSQFTGAGAAQFQAASGAHSLTVNLQLDITNETGQIFGDVTNNGEWDATLAADLAPTWTTKSPSPLTGSYTMSLPWDTGTEAANEAGGDSYGVGTVSKLGVLTLAGALADGTTFSSAAPVFTNGQWPFYVYAASGKDEVLGWVTVSSNGLSGTNISWSKAAGKGPLYPAGFTNVLQLIGSTWQAPAKGADALALSNAAVTLSGGNLPQTLTIPVKLQNSTTFTATNLNLSITASSGSFSGWFYAPGTKKQVKFSGVVLTNEATARGFFLGTDESGAVLLQGP